jgi:hypothetical protein
MLKMPRDGAIIFSDLIGKLDALSVSVRAGWPLYGEELKRQGWYKEDKA